GAVAGAAKRTAAPAKPVRPSYGIASDAFGTCGTQLCSLVRLRRRRGRHERAGGVSEGVQVEPRSRRRLPELPAFLTPDRVRVIFAFGAVVLVFVVGDILHPGFASAASVKAILLTASFVGFVAAGQTFVVL